MDNNIKNLRVFEVKYLRPTNSKGARLKIIDLRAKEFGVNNSIILEKDDKYLYVGEQAIDFLHSKGCEINFRAGNLLLTSNFSTCTKLRK